MTRNLLVAVFVALLAVCQIWLVPAGGPLRGEGGNAVAEDAGSSMERELVELEHLERFLVRELTEKQLRELTDDQREEMIGMNEDQRKLFIFECFGAVPSASPSFPPSSSPSLSSQPSISARPSAKPSSSPSMAPSLSSRPSIQPSESQQPSSLPSSQPPSTSPTGDCFFTQGTGHRIEKRVRNFLNRGGGQ